MFKHPLKKGPSGLFFFASYNQPTKTGKPAYKAGLPLAVAATAWLLTSLVPSPTAAQARLLPTTTLGLGPVSAYVEIAATPESRNRGLMFRQHLPADHGMLFVFEQDTSQCFWMKNTPLPLTIAFIDAQGQIINMRNMQPHSEANHCPTRPMRYALEMQQGWFTQYGIAAGQHIKGLPEPR